MSPIFDFNADTARFLSPDQQAYFLSPFVASREAYEATMVQSFPKAYRRAGRVAVRELTVVIIRDMHEELRKFPAVMLMPTEQDPSTWGYAFRYRADVPWYIAVLSGRFEEPAFGSYPVVQLLHTKDLIHWPPLDRFISDGLWGVQQNKTPNWNPLENFLFGLSSYMRPKIVVELGVALQNVNFFPVETDDELEYKLEMDKSENAWEEIRGMARSFFHPMTDVGLAEFWTKVKNHPRTQVWVARSHLYPEPDQDKAHWRSKFSKRLEPTMLGFLIGGMHPISEEPQIHAVCVLPDERRRGIATSLVKRFFSQTGYASVCAGVYMGPQVYQYEAAALLKKMGGSITVKGRFVWHWKLPSPVAVNAHSMD